MVKVFAIRACATMASVFVFGALGAAGAAAATSRPGIEIGPIKAGHGYTVTLDEPVCPTSASSGLTIEFDKGSKLSISHDYAGGASSCRVSGKLASGTVSAKWGGLATIKLKLKPAGKVKKQKPPKGCSGSVGQARAAVATGTLKIAIHPGLFGKIKLHRARAALERFGTISCHVAGSTGVSLFGTFGNFTVSANQPVKGQRSVTISGSGPTLAGGIKDGFFLDALGGSSLFNAKSDIASATIGKAGSLIDGSMTFTGLPECVGSPGARNGSFAGALVAHDPVVGTFTLAGSEATDGFIASGDAAPGDCNGPGAIPSSAGFTNTCSAPNICSVSDTTNTDTFFDTSDPGTQGTIRSETWNFGDGSAPVPAIPGASINHTYTTPGTYPVTLTIVDGQGTTRTATGTSYIDP